MSDQFLPTSSSAATTPSDSAAATPPSDVVTIPATPVTPAVTVSPAPVIPNGLTKGTKAKIGTAIATLFLILTTVAPVVLPADVAPYITAVVAVIGAVATAFGIYIPTNEQKK